MLQEKRRDNRIHINLEVSLERKYDIYRCYTVDIGNRGCRIWLSEDFNEGESVIVNLRTPVKHWVTLSGVIVHQTRYGEYGIKFDPFSDTEALLLRSVIDYLEHN